MVLIGKKSEACATLDSSACNSFTGVGVVRRSDVGATLDFSALDTSAGVVFVVRVS